MNRSTNRSTTSNRDSSHRGSSLRASTLARLDRALDGFFRHRAPLAAGDSLLVAFSGGPDSTALLAAAVRFGRRRGVRIVAAHLDHGLDHDSPSRARAARRTALALGIPCCVGRRPVEDLRRPGESIEAAARRVRYRFLDQLARREGVRWIATAHHRNDQVETVLLRLLFGSGWQGLAGILPLRGGDSGPAIVRPLLELPRSLLGAALRAEGISGIEDPSNLDLARPRNRLRHVLVPHLEHRWPGLGDRLVRLAEAARLARERVGERLSRAVGLRAGSRDEAVLGTVSLDALTRLPPEIMPTALAVLHRASRVAHPPGRKAIRELRRQLGPAGAGPGSQGPVGVACGGGLRWERRGDRLALIRPPDPAPMARFAYTLQIPGELVIEEIGVGFRMTRGPAAPWMFLSSKRRAGMLLPVREGDRVEIRNRRPGDRFRPLGAPGRRRLKEILIDRKVPRNRRDRLPLLVVCGRLAWVPGVAVEDRYRLPLRRAVEEAQGRDEIERQGGPHTVWIAEIFDP